jgi:hypothetical protein
MGKRIITGLVAIIFFASCMVQQKINVKNGSLFGKPFSGQVGDDFSATILTNRTDSCVMEFYEQYDTAKLSNTLLKEITKKYSLDVSTLFLAEKLYKIPANKRAEDDYFSKKNDFENKNLASCLDFLKNYHIVFIPGFNYEENKGSFLEQSELLDSANISNEIIATQPLGLIEDNAKIVADSLRAINKRHNNIILVSISKGGTETGIALSRLLLPEDITSVKGWLNASGILKGTPVADYWMQPFKKMWIGLGLLFAGKGNLNLKEMMTDLSYENRKHEIVKIPEKIYTVNFVVTSLGQNSNRIIMQVPNDGYSPLLDEITEGGVTIMEIGNGLNHTLQNLDVNISLAAMLCHIVEHIENINEKTE